MRIPAQQPAVDRAKRTDLGPGSRASVWTAVAPQQQCLPGTSLCHCLYGDTCCKQGQLCDCSIAGIARCVSL